MSTISPNLPNPPSQEKGLIPEGLKLSLILILILAVIYLFYDSYSSGQANQATQKKLDTLAEQVHKLELSGKVTEAAFSSQVSHLKSDIVGTQKEVDNTQVEFKKTASQIQAEGQKTKRELSQALGTKADTSQVSQVEAQVQAAKSETESKIGQVNTEVGGVKTQVSAVKSDLEATRRDLEGTQRRLEDVHETLNAAVAKNATELAQLRLKGERKYIEFTISKTKESTKVEDIRLMLTKVDVKKGKFSLKIFADDSQLEKKDRLINEPMQFLVGQNRVRYEVVINLVQKDKASGYLSIPKDRSLSAERPKEK
jgi:predicted  nucleic acid-binding Zn-ribbon protein